MTVLVVLSLSLAIAIFLLLALGRWMRRELAHRRELGVKNDKLSKDLEKNNRELESLRKAITSASNLSDAERYQFTKTLEDLRMEIQQVNKKIASLREDNDKVRSKNHSLENDINETFVEADKFAYRRFREVQDARATTYGGYTDDRFDRF